MRRMSTQNVEEKKKPSAEKKTPSAEKKKATAKEEGGKVGNVRRGVAANASPEHRRPTAVGGVSPDSGKSGRNPKSESGRLKRRGPAQS
jgi:hypothetical protein